MTRRSRPCQDCKKHRRKCVRSQGIASCDRCLRLDRECIFTDQNAECVEEEDDNDSRYSQDADCDATVDGDKILRTLYEEMATLQRQMEQLDKALKGSKTPSKELQRKDFSTPEQRFHSQAQLLHSYIPSDWQLTIKNGRIRLETGIRSISELLSYSQRIRYLSPLSSSQNDASVMYFESKSPSMVSTAMKLVKNNLISARATRPSFPSLTYSTSSSTFESDSSWYLQIEPQIAMIQLIDQYFTCYNKSAPFLHEPTFRARLRSLNDPTTCPITLALCTFMAVGKCKHSQYSTRENRIMSEYFYSKCNAILLDTFDDPDRRLETVITINLLQKFYYVTLRFSESRKMATIADLICQDLTLYYADKNTPIVERVLFERHKLASSCYTRMVEFFAENKKDDLDHVLPDQPSFDSLPDESPVTIGLIDVYNRILKVGKQPCSVAIMKQARRMLAGEVGIVSIDLMLGYEQTMQEWWSSLPEEIQICKDPYDYETAKAAVELFRDQRQFVVFVYMLTMMGSVNSCLISPRRSDANEDISSMIRERACEITLQCSELLILCAKKLTTSDLFCHCIISSEFLFRTAESLMSLTAVKGSAAVQQTLAECLREIDLSYLQDHRVPSSQSPLAMLAIEPNNAPIASMYDEYPLPGYAFMYDVYQHSTSKLGFGEQTKIQAYNSE